MLQLQYRPVICSPARQLAAAPLACDHNAMQFRVSLFLGAAPLLFAQSGKPADPGRPPLFFREDFKETPAATPITQEHIVNPNLILSLYGAGKDGMRKSHHDTPSDDPYYIWDGSCEGNCAA